MDWCLEPSGRGARPAPAFSHILGLNAVDKDTDESTEAEATDARLGAASRNMGYQ